MDVLSILEGVFGLPTLLLHHLTLDLMDLLSLVKVADPHGAQHLALFFRCVFLVVLVNGTALGRLVTSPRGL